MNCHHMEKNIKKVKFVIRLNQHFDEVLLQVDSL